MAGDRRARRALKLLHRLSFHLSGAQLGITISSLVLGYAAEPTVARAIEPVLAGLGLPEATTVGVSLALALVLATGTQMVAGELVPKNLAISRPLGVALALSGPVTVYGILFGPLIRVLNGAANWTVRRLRIEPQEELNAVRSMEELELLIRSSGEEGTLPEESATLLTRTIRFGHKTAADALVPRRSVVALRTRQSVADVAKVVVESGHTRFPVYGSDADDVVGMLHAKDIFRVPPKDRSKTPVSEVMRDVPAIPETRDLESLLAEMRRGSSQLAVVVDEHGDTVGIITLEDLLEEIVGEISDEHDPDDEEAAAPITETSFLLDGSLHRDEVLEATGFDMPEGEYRTLAGFLLTLFDRIPAAGDTTTHERWTFTVEAMDNLRIAEVRIDAPPTGDPE